MLLSLAATLILSARSELPVVQVATLVMPKVENRIYAGDIAIDHIADGRPHVLDANSGKYLGLIGTSFAGDSTQSPEGRK
jgi:methylamine dehydrogenase heavy chain